MKILRIISTVSPRFGGPVEGIRQITPFLAQHGHTTEIVSLDSPNAPWIADFPLLVHALGPSQGAYRFSPRLTPWLKKNAHNYDAVIIHGLWQYASFGAWRALHNSQTPYFVYTHGMLDPWLKKTYPLKHLKKCLYWSWADYRVLRDARAVLFTSEEERRLAKQSFSDYQCTEVVLNSGTVSPQGDSALLRGQFLEAHPKLQNKRLLLFLSRIHPEKGCDLLLKALDHVADSDPALHLIMAGPNDSGWQSELERLAQSLGISERVTWTGMLTGEKKWGAFHAADAFVLPSHQEDFGIAAAEALACGLPVLISDKIHIWREITADKAGLVAEDTEAGTVQLLQNWLALAPTEREQMRLQARHCFLSRFEIEAAAKSFVSAVSVSKSDASPTNSSAPSRWIGRTLFAGGFLMAAISAGLSAIALCIPDLMRVLDPVFDGTVNGSLGLAPVASVGTVAGLTGAGLTWIERRGTASKWVQSFHAQGDQENARTQTFRR